MIKIASFCSRVVETIFWQNYDFVPQNFFVKSFGRFKTNKCSESVKGSGEEAWIRRSVPSVETSLPLREVTETKWTVLTRFFFWSLILYDQIRNSVIDRGLDLALIATEKYFWLIGVI